MTGETQTISEAELNAFCDGELDDAANARVARALEADPALRARMAEIMSDIAAMREAAERERVDPATEALAARLGAAVERKERRLLAFRAGGGAVSVAAVALAGWFGHAYFVKTMPVKSRQGGQVVAQIEEAVPGFVADAAGAHAIFAPDDFHPVEFTASDEAAMASWFSTHLGREAMIPHLEELGFDLVGGRLLGDAEGAMAQVIYQNDRGDRVSLVFGKRQVPGDEGLKLVHIGKSYASYWQDRGFAWAVVEDSPGADVSTVATHIARMTRDGARPETMTPE